MGRHRYADESIEGDRRPCSADTHYGFARWSVFHGRRQLGIFDGTTAQQAKAAARLAILTRHPGATLPAASDLVAFKVA